MTLNILNYLQKCVNCSFIVRVNEIILSFIYSVMYVISTANLSNINNAGISCQQIPFSYSVVDVFVDFLVDDDDDVVVGCSFVVVVFGVVVVVVVVVVLVTIKLQCVQLVV